MRKFIYNITSGYPETIYPAILWATVEAVSRLIPATIVYFGVKELYDSFRFQQSLDTQLFIWLAAASVIWFICQLCISTQAYDHEYLAAYNVSAKGRTDLANHLRKLSLGFLDSRDSGDLTTMMLSDYALVETAISHLVPQAFSALILLTLAFVTLCMIDFWMTVCLYATLPLSLMIIYSTNAYQKRLGEKHVKAKIDSASRLQEYLQGIKEIKSYSLGGEKFSRLDEAFSRLRKESIRLEGILGPIVMSSISLLRMGLPILVFAGSYMLAQENLSDSVFLIFIIVASRIYDPFTTLMLNYTEMKYSSISAERIMEIRSQPEILGSTPFSEDCTIHFNDVSFSYKESPTLQSINLTIRPKTLTALVGPSGSGKSTIVKLIARFYDVAEGEIRIGSTPLNQIKPEALYQNMSMVFQDVYLFKDTIINNIRVGKLDASYEEVVEAAKKAKCHEFIMALPDGYDTMVGEGGSTLSGGEKQRVSIARAFIKKSEIILLDEATAALDLENEAAVQKAISALVADKTVIVIAHRLRTIRHADKIVVLDQGKILAQGTHNSLYKECELYRNLTDMQDQARQWVFT